MPALIGVAVIFHQGSQLFMASGTLVGHTYQVISSVEELVGQVAQAEAAKWEYLAEGSQDKVSELKRAREMSVMLWDRLDEQTLDNPRQQEISDELRVKFEEKIRYAE